MTDFRFKIVALTLVLAGSLRAAHAQGGGEPNSNLAGITVAGKGTVGAKPNRLEIEMEISAASEISSDVIVKYRDARKRLQEAFAALKMSNVTVEERALAVDQKGQSFNPYYMDSPPARKGKVEVQLSRKLVVNCSNIRELDEEALLRLVAKLLDVAQDAGGKVGSSGENNYYSYRYGNQNSALVHFILDDFEAQQDKAFQAAVNDAKARANRLARLSDLELGPVLGVREVQTPGEGSTPSMSYNPYIGMVPSTDNEEMPQKRLQSTRFHEIPVKVELQVRFSVASHPKVAQGGAAK